MAAAATKGIESDAEIADGEGEAASAKAGGKRRFSRKRLLMLAAAVVVVGAGGAGGYVFLRGHGEAAAPPVAQVKPPVFFDMPEVVVNLSNTGNERTQYLKVRVVLELPDQALVAQLQPLMPRLIDTFQTYLRELRPTDLNGSAGLYRLREELTRRVNAAIEPNRINAVLFKEIVVQ